MKVGLAGAHRVGKTTLAKDIGTLPYLKTDVAGIFASRGIAPTSKLSFVERMDIQWRLLEHLRQRYETKASFVTDRTPLDLIAYTLAEVTDEVAESMTIEQVNDLTSYIDECLITLLEFDRIFVVRPGIPVVEADCKGSTNPLFIAKIDSLIAGFADRVTRIGLVRFVPFSVTGRLERVDFVTNRLHGK